MLIQDLHLSLVSVYLIYLLLYFHPFCEVLFQIYLLKAGCSCILLLFFLKSDLLRYNLHIVRIHAIAFKDHSSNLRQALPLKLFNLITSLLNRKYSQVLGVRK